MPHSEVNQLSLTFSFCSFWKSSDRTNRFSGYDECVSTKYLMPALLRLAKHPVILQLLFRQVCGASFYYYLLKLFCSFNKESVIMILRCQIKCFYGFALLVTASLSGCSLSDKHHGGVNKVPIRTLIKGWRRKAQEQSIRLSNRLQPYPENLLTPVLCIIIILVKFLFLETFLLSITVSYITF